MNQRKKYINTSGKQVIARYDISGSQTLIRA
jgi:hypothetical protein